MITEPVTSADHASIRDLVRTVVESTYTSERVRAAAASPAGYDEVAWKQLVDLGWASLTADAESGDDDFGPVVQCIVHRELGARLAPSPYLAGVAFAATALAGLGGPAALPLLRAIGAGDVTAALVGGHGRGWPGGDASTVTAGERDGQWLLDGGVHMVLDGGRASTLVVVAALPDDGWGLFQVEGSAASVTRTAVTCVDLTRSFADVAFDGAPAVPLHAEPIPTSALAAAVDKTAILLAAEMVGAAVACLRQTLDYLRTRHQFGKPIGSFQALKHRCADLAVNVTVVQELLFAAAQMWAAGNDEALHLAAPLLLGRTGEVFKHATEEAIQLHGGVGFTDEFDIGLYYKRALVDAELIAVPADAYARMTDVRREVLVS